MGQENEPALLPDVSLPKRGRSGSKRESTATGQAKSQKAATKPDQPKPAKARTRLKSQIDPYFKQIMTKLALEAGLDNGPTELQVQRSTLSDLLLIVPSLVSLVGTILDFFRRVNIIEFKSDSDKFDKATFATQVGRVNIWYGRNSKLADFSEILNVIILARYQPEVFDYAQERNCPFQMVDNQEWLWMSRQGLQDVVIVICERLPVEPRYYDWLLFMPAHNQKWERSGRKFVGAARLGTAAISKNVEVKGVCDAFTRYR